MKQIELKEQEEMKMPEKKSRWSIREEDIYKN